MAKLFRRVQLGTALETSTAVKPSALESTVGNYDIAALDLDFSPDVESFDREFARTSTTRVKGTQGQKAVGISFRTELVGTTLGTFAGGAPGFGKVLQAAGMRQEAHDTLEIDIAAAAPAITLGPFRHGEILDLNFDGGSGATEGKATLIHDVHNGDLVMYLWNVTAPVEGTGHTGLTITGESSGTTTASITDITTDATFATAYTANIGYSWWPISETIKRLDTDDLIDNAAAAGDLIEGQTSGARAIFSAQDAAATPERMEFIPIRGTFQNTPTEVLQNLTQALKYSDTGDPAVEEFKFGGTIAAYANLDGTGVVMLGARTNAGLVFEVNRQVFIQVESRGFFDSVSDLPLLTSDSISSATPPLWQGTDTYFADNEDTTGEEDRSAEIIPCLTGLEMSLGNQFGDRRCSSASAGLEEVIIQQRQGTANVKTEATFEGDIDFLGKLQSGVVMRTRTTVGTVAGNQFYVTAPGIQYESAGQENANGLRVYNMGAKLTGGAIHNLNGAVPAEVVLSGVGGDNELVISYITTA